MSDSPLPFDRNRRLPPDPLDKFTLPEGEPGEVVTLADFAGAGSVDPKTGDISIPTEDGGVVVQIDPRPQRSTKDDEAKFFRNLAEDLDQDERGRIVEEVMRGVEADEQSRQEWLETRAEGIKMLGTVLEKATGDIGNSTGPFEGMSTVRHPLLMEACVR